MSVDIPKSKLAIRYARSGGPGGQNVNKVETKVEIRLAIEDLDVDRTVADRVRARLRTRLDADGRIVVSSSRFRLRSRNLRDALDRLQDLLDAAARPPIARVATGPTRGAIARRRASKSHRSRQKSDRRKRGEED